MDHTTCLWTHGRIDSRDTNNEKHGRSRELTEDDIKRESTACEINKDDKKKLNATKEPREEKIKDL